MHGKLEDFLSVAERAELERPIEEARGLPGRLYVSEEFFELERQTLFRGTWMAVAAASQVPNPGDVLPVSVAGWLLVVVRGTHGELNVFHNICRHRGTAVVTGAAEQQRVLRCPWHGWCYELDGTLLGTPEIEGVGKHESAGIDKADHGLVRVRSQIWCDFRIISFELWNYPVFCGVLSRT